MREEFEKLVLANKINHDQAEALVRLVEAGFCQHRSWGFGKVNTVDTIFSRVIIDFIDKSGHSMDLGFAANTLEAIDSSHILARKYTDLAGLKQTAALHHLDLVKLACESYGGTITLDQVQKILVPDVVSDDWKKWWDAAKREMKKDGHFKIPSRRTEPITYIPGDVSPEDRMWEEFREAKGLKARAVVTADIVKTLKDLPSPADLVKNVISTLNKDIAMHLEPQPAVALEGILAREDLAREAGLESVEGTTPVEFWQSGPALPDVLEKLPVNKHRAALLAYKDANPNLWHEGVLALVNEAPARLVGECVDLLCANERIDDLKSLLRRLVNHHQASSELLLWMGKARSDAFADVMGPEVFRAMLTAIERDQFNEVKTNRLGDFIMDDQDLMGDVIGSADIEVVKDVTRMLKMSPSFEDMSKRSLLARIVKLYPAVQSLISGESTRQDSGLLVTWESLENRRKEYEEVVQKKIPANSKEIAIARSYGDLRENHEYKAAKEMQKILMRRKAELETDLSRARGTDFADARTDVVSPGTRVELVNTKSGETETYTILGAWDNSPELGVISYLTPLAQAVLNRPPGVEVSFEMEGETQSYRVVSITAAPVVSSETTA